MQVAHIVRIADFRREPTPTTQDNAQDDSDPGDPGPTSQASPKKGERRVQLRIPLETPDQARQALQILVQEAQHCLRILASQTGGADMDDDRRTAVRQRLEKLNRRINARWQGQ